jgi:DNA-binding PadR family transcriptional regulator
MRAIAVGRVTSEDRADGGALYPDVAGGFYLKSLSGPARRRERLYSCFNYMADPRVHLPLKPVDLELLLALAGEDRHGYGLVQAIAGRTGGLVVVDPGNLYRVIKRLLADGLVAEAGQRTAADADGERRRYYRITGLGERVLAAELRRLRALVSAPDARAIARRSTS